MITLVLVDVDAKLPAEQLVAGAAALNTQVQRDFGPAWGRMATVRAADALSPPCPGEWIVELEDMPPPTVQGALGYHDRAATGEPILHVFVGLGAQCGATWTSIASHEICEALADPDLVWAAQAPDGVFWALEVCDPVETVTYLIDGVEVSDFVTPAWFAPKAPHEVYDQCGKLRVAFQVLTPNDYAQKFVPGTGWQQVGAMREYRKRIGDLGLGRASRRAS